MSWLSAARTRLHLLFAGRAAESRMDEEIGFHIDMETERLVREEGLAPDEARRRALASFGGVARHKEELVDGRGLAWLGGLSLDLKLGFRMLSKYPGLTIIGGLAMAFAIWVGAVTFQLVTLFVHPTLPLPDGDRIMALQHWDAAANGEGAATARDFLGWREALSTVTDLGAYRDVSRNLITAGGDAHPVDVAEITASAFRIAPAPPLLGRVLVAADERAGAPPVVVLGHDVWETRFASDPNVVGRSVRLGDAYATVVGVMPEGFAFPVAHELWTPLRPDLLGQAPDGGPSVGVFGRLAPGATLEGARAELATLGRRAAAERPETHGHLQPRVGPYAQPNEQSMADQAAMLSIPFFAVMLLVLVCGNVALLLFARAATRERELVVRSALGASRRRIVMQLFAEALVLGGVAAAVGLGAAWLALDRWGLEFLEVNLGRVPFWFDPRLSPATVLYAVGLTVLAAVIAGVLPALKITRGLGSKLKEGTAGSGVRFGGVWTAVIVAQVAVTVAFPGAVLIEQRELRRIQSFDAGFAAEEYLGVALEMDAAAAVPGADAGAARAAEGARYGAVLEEVRRRLEAEPGVAGVTFVDRLPRTFHRERIIEIEGEAAAPAPTAQTAASEPVREVSTALIDPSYFEVLGAPILAGRAFHAGDLTPDARVVIVDQAFADQVLPGRSPVGRRVRFASAPNPDGSVVEEPWLEIVGVVKELGMTFVAHQHRAAGVYLPAALGSAGSLHMVVHARGDPLSLAPRLREITAAVDPTLRLSGLQRLDQVKDGFVWFLRLWLRVTVLLTAIALLLSLAGIYAVLSFTVARRTREIGVRIALGASRRRLVVGIFRRPLTQVGVGVVAGGVLIVLAAVLLAGGDGDMGHVEGGFSPTNLAMLAAYVAFMLAVCLLACVVPTHRALRVEPTEALRTE